MSKKIDKQKIQTWFVTGASSGIGKELCTQLLLRGYNVIAVSRRLPTFEGGGKSLNLSVDVTDINSIKNAINKGIEHFGSIDVLANIAGISSYQTLEEETLEKMRSVMETNYWGTYNTCYSLIKYFRERNNGTILNCTSVMGLVPRVCGAAYCSSKHAVEGLTSVLWLETRNFNCRVMSIEPGLFASDISKNETNKFKSEFNEYKFPYTNIIDIRRNYQNDTAIAMNFLIDTVEKEKMPRRLLLGKDCIQRVKYEVKTILDDIKYAIPSSNKMAIKNKKTLFSFNNIQEYIEYRKYGILTIFSVNKKKEYYNQKRIELKKILQNKVGDR